MNALRRACLLGTAALLLNACGSQNLTLPSSGELLGKAPAPLPGPAPANPAPPDPVPANPTPEPGLDTANLPAALSLRVGESRQITPTMGGQAAAAGRLKWQSSDPRIVSVTDSGVLSAHQAGQARVQITETARPERGFALSVQVQADPPPPAQPDPVKPPAPTPTPAPPPAPTSNFAAEVLRLTNLARAQGGNCSGEAYPPAPALSWNALLASAAQAHAADMAAKNYFDHTSLDGRSFVQRIDAAGYIWRSVAENIAAGQQTPAEVVNGWIASTGHCKNIFNASLKDLGVGYAEGGSYGKYWVQDFGTPR